MSSQSPYTNNAGTVFPFQGSGNPLATAASVTAGITTATNAAVVTLYESVTATATADGLTTGTITSTANDVFVTVTSADANNIVVLPTPTPGRKVRLINGATGYEIRSSDPATIGINGGTGAAAESAIGASTYVELMCTTATNWVGRQYAAAGTLAVVQVAAP